MAGSKNGTFLLHRGYMDYHSHRFTDHSLMFYRKERLYAVLPANIQDGTLYSHQGLTYGGLISGKEATAADTVTLFQEMNAYLRKEHIGRVVYKCVPWIYHRIPSEEDLYAIFRTCAFRLICRNISTVLATDEPIKWEKSRSRGVRKAMRNGLTVERSNDWKAFWKVLEDNLMHTHNAHPVHSLQEMELLKSRFPDNIFLYVARHHEEVVGGYVIYLTPPTAHAQYISATKEGKQMGAIDTIFHHIIHEDFAHVPYFDFGKSTEGHGETLNEGLIFQKEGFGGRGVCYDWYEWDLSSDSHD